jgi:hypothetical protein
MQNVKPYIRNLEILNHKIIDFDLEINKKSEINIIDNMWEQGYDFNNLKLSSKQFKCLFLNFFIKNILDFLMKQEKSCFFIISKPQSSEFFEHIKKDIYYKAYSTNINTLLNLLPLNAITDFNNSYNDIILSKESELNEWLISNICKCKDKNSKYSLKKVKNKIRYYNLKYLDNKIFEELRFKKIF